MFILDLEYSYWLLDICFFFTLPTPLFYNYPMRILDIGKDFVFNQQALQWAVEG